MRDDSELRQLLAEAEACALAGRAEAGIGLALEAEDLARRANDLNALSHALRLLGTFHRLASRHDIARRYFDQATEAFEALGNAEGVAEVALQQGQMALDLGDYVDAIDRFGEALEHTETGELPLLRSRLLTGLGIASARAGDFGRAESVYREALDLQQSLGNEAAIANTVHCLGVLELRRVETRPQPTDGAADPRLLNALALLDESHALAEKTGRTRLAGMCINERGRALRLAGQHAQAIKNGQTAIALFRALPAPKDECDAMLHLAHAWLAAGDLTRAIGEAEAGLELARTGGFRPAERDAHLLLSRCHEAKGDDRTALAHLKRVREIEHDLRDSEVMRGIARLEHARSLAVSEAERVALAERAELLDRLAATDSLTGLINRRGFESAFEKRSSTLEEALLLAADIDHFKQINDRFGHDVGDRVLQRTAQAIVHACREHDLVGRWGGEEFLILLAEADLDTAARVADRMREAVRSIDWTDVAPALRVTLSVGVAAMHRPLELGELIRRADRALYAAKAQGRNRVVVDRDQAAPLVADAPTQNDATSSR